MYAHQEEVANQISGREFFALGIKTLEYQVGIVMVIAGNAHQRESVDNCNMNLVQIITGDLLDVMCKEPVARGESTFGNSVLLNNCPKRWPIILRWQQFETLITLFKSVDQILAVDAVA